MEWSVSMQPRSWPEPDPMIAAAIRSMYRGEDQKGHFRHLEVAFDLGGDEGIRTPDPFDAKHSYGLLDVGV
jgi:hypothetical protein